MSYYFYLLFLNLLTSIFSSSFSLLCSSSDLPHDLWPRQCHGEDSQPDWYDAAVVPLGRLSAVPGPHAAGLPSRLLGFQEPDGGESLTSRLHLCECSCFFIRFSERFHCVESKKTGHDIRFELDEARKARSQLVWTVRTIFISDGCSEVQVLVYLCVYRARLFIRSDVVCSSSALIGSCSDTSVWDEIDSRRHQK